MAACGNLMVGSGPDTYDPVCELLKGHYGPCKSTGAIDQHVCAQIETARALLVAVGQVWVRRRGDRSARVEITARHDVGGTLMFTVKRNTSNRVQSIGLNTLLRDYKRSPHGVA